MVMRNILIALTASLSLLACGGSSTEIVSSDTAVPVTTSAPETTTTVVDTTTTQAPTPATRPTITAPAEPDMNGYQPDVFLSMIEKDLFYWNISYTDDVLINIGNLSCQEFDAGTEVEDYLVTFYVMVSDQDPLLAENVGLFLRYAIRYLCPEHYNKIPNTNS
jgi:hypothetical protein